MRFFTRNSPYAENGATCGSHHVILCVTCPNLPMTGALPMRQAMKFVVVVALAVGSVSAGVGAAEASSGHTIAGGLGCCRAFQ